MDNNKIIKATALPSSSVYTTQYKNIRRDIRGSQGTEISIFSVRPLENRHIFCSVTEQDLTPDNKTWPRMFHSVEASKQTSINIVQLLHLNVCVHLLHVSVLHCSKNRKFLLHLIFNSNRFHFSQKNFSICEVFPHHKVRCCERYATSVKINQWFFFCHIVYCCLKSIVENWIMF